MRSKATGVRGVAIVAKGPADQLVVPAATTICQVQAQVPSADLAWATVRNYGEQRQQREEGPSGISRSCSGLFRTGHIG
jgi:hypothetical protein